MVLLTAPTPAFLDELCERARRYGWRGGDYVEIAEFVEHLYKRAGLPMPSLDPYTVCAECGHAEPECTCVIRKEEQV